MGNKDKEVRLYNENIPSQGALTAGKAIRARSRRFYLGHFLHLVLHLLLDSITYCFQDMLFIALMLNANLYRRPEARRQFADRDVLPFNQFLCAEHWW